MRRGLYRSIWLLIIGTLVVLLSLPPMAATSDTAASQPPAPAVAGSVEPCTSAMDSRETPLDWHTVLDRRTISTTCTSLPATVLIVKGQQAQRAAVESPVAAVSGYDAVLSSY